MANERTAWAQAEQRTYQVLLDEMSNLENDKNAFIAEWPVTFDFEKHARYVRWEIMGGGKRLDDEINQDQPTVDCTGDWEKAAMLAALYRERDDAILEGGFWDEIFPMEWEPVGDVVLRPGSGDPVRGIRRWYPTADPMVTRFTMEKELRDPGEDEDDEGGEIRLWVLRMPMNVMYFSDDD